MSWQVVILRGGGKEEGPFSEEEILDLLDAGEVTRNDWCRVEGQPYQQRLGELFQTISPEADLKSARDPDGDIREEGEFFPDLARAGGVAPAADEADDQELELAPEEPELEDADDLEMPEDNAPPEAEEAEGGYGEDFGRFQREQLLFAGCPSWLSYWKSFALVAAVLVAGYWAGALGGWWLGAAFALACLLLARAFIARASHDYSISTERVECTHGLISKTSREIRLDDVRAINVVESGLAGLLGVGTIIFSSVGGPKDDVIFTGVRRAHQIKQLVRDWQPRGA